MLSVFMAMGLLSGCESGSRKTANENVTSAEQTDQKTAEDGKKVLTTAVSAELTTLYPLNMDIQNNIADKLVYEGLVNYVDGEVVPCLAESWEFSEDGCDITFHLKQGVTFHDGTPFDAEAVKKNFEFGMTNENFSNIAAVANLEGVDAVDEYTAVFHYPTPYFAYMMDFCYPEVMILVSPSAIEEGNYQNMKDVIGTGPYIYDELADGQYVKFVRNENYWGEKPYYDEVIVKYIPEASARLQALQNGEIDMIFGSALISWDDYEQATQLPDIKGVVAGQDSNTRNLVLNASRGPLTDKRVREAIAHAVDKQGISDGLTYGNETPAIKLFQDQIPYTDGKLNVERSYDPEKAKALLDEAGWILNSKTGIREKDGQSLALVLNYDSGIAFNKPLVTVIKSQLGEAGIEVSTVGQEQMTWWKEGVAGNYDLIIWNTEQPYTCPHNFFLPMLARTPHTPSLTGIEGSDKFLSLIKEFQTTNDAGRVEEIFTELLNFDNDNVLDLPLTYVKDVAVFNEKKISDYTFTSTPMFFDVSKIRPAE